MLFYFFFYNSILFAICTSTFSKLCKQRIKQHVERRSVALPCIYVGSKPRVAFGNKAYKLNLKTKITNTRITLRIGRQIIWQMSSQSPLVWSLHEVRY
jgi:hypothetical protein